MPNCNPFLAPSPFRASNGNPALSSTRNAPCLYINPTPAEAEGWRSGENEDGESGRAVGDKTRDVYAESRVMKR